MATPDSLERAAEPAQATAVAQATTVEPSSNIWADDRGCRSKIKSRRALIASAVTLCAALALILFLVVPKSSNHSSEDISAQSYDVNSLGCFVDERHDRVMPYVYSDPISMTPALCHDHCDARNYTYYALQWGQECWCGGSDVDYDMYGTGICDYDCPGDSAMICGGYLAFTAYEVGVDASEPVSVPSAASCGTDIADITIGDEIVYFTGGGCATLTDLFYTEGSDDILFVLDANDDIVDGASSPTGRWLLAADLRVEDGSTLYFHGTSIDGDCDVLRIKSEGSSSYYEVRGHGGNLSFKSTKVTSWDTESGEEQTSYSSGRSFINCVSEQVSDDTCDGATTNDMGECRMDIIDSVMGNLGFFDSESYGLTWKVRGFCTDLSNPEVFDRTAVYGDIQGSEIYGMYYGMYSYGHQGGVWTNNTMRDNILYGFDPHDDSDDLTIAYNKVYGNGNHGIIASKRCDNLKIYGNEVYDGGEDAAGIFLHRSSDDSEVYNNYVHDMQNAGFALMEAMNNDIHDNTVENVKWGIRLSVGSSDNNIYDNTFDSCSSSGFYTYEGSDDPWVSNGRMTENTFHNNVVSNTEVGVDMGEGDDNVFTNNIFLGTTTLEFDDTEGTTWSANTLPSGACVEADSSTFTDDSDAIPDC